MNNWFLWNGVRCTEKGLQVADLPSPTVPAERVTFINIPERAGSLTTLKGENVHNNDVPVYKIPLGSYLLQKDLEGAP